MDLPIDGHVHTEWSWDAPTGSMERSCARALEVGLPAIAFTEHVDHTVTTVATAERIEPATRSWPSPTRTAGSPRRPWTSRGTSPPSSGAATCSRTCGS